MIRGYTTVPKGCKYGNSSDIINIFIIEREICVQPIHIYIICIWSVSVLPTFWHCEQTLSDVTSNHSYFTISICLSIDRSVFIFLSHSLSLHFFSSLSLSHTQNLSFIHSLTIYLAHTHTHTHIFSSFSDTHTHSLTHSCMYILEFLDHVGFSQWSQYPDEEFNLADDSKWEVRSLLLVFISVRHKFRNFIIIFFIFYVNFINIF